MKISSLVTGLLASWILTFSIGVSKFGPVPIKATILLLYLMFSFAALLGKSKVSLKYFPMLAILFFWIGVSVATGILNGFGLSVVSQGASVILSILAVITSFVLYDNNLLKINFIERAIYFAAAIGVSFKVLIGLGVIAGLFSAESINLAMSDYFGSASYEVDIFGGFMGILPRIGNAGDLLYLIIFIFFATKYNRKPILVFAFMWLTMLLFVFVSYSRFLMVIFLAASFCIFFYKIRVYPIKSFLLGVALAMMILSADIIDLSSVVLALYDRFTGQVQFEADSIRSEMAAILFKSFYENMLFGLGLGGYINHYTRSEINLWQYELEYLSLLMQLGLTGFLFIVINYLIYTIFVLFKNFDKKLLLPLMLSVLTLIVVPLQSSLFCGTQWAVIILSIFFLSRDSNINICKYSRPFVSR